VCILFHTAICGLGLGLEHFGLGLGLGTAGLDYKSGPMWSDAVISHTPKWYVSIGVSVTNNKVSDIFRLRQTEKWPQNDIFRLDGNKRPKNAIFRPAQTAIYGSHPTYGATYRMWFRLPVPNPNPKP